MVNQLEVLAFYKDLFFQELTFRNQLAVIAITFYHILNLPLGKK